MGCLRGFQEETSDVSTGEGGNAGRRELGAWADGEMTWWEAEA